MADGGWARDGEVQRTRRGHGSGVMEVCGRRYCATVPLCHRVLSENSHFQVNDIECIRLGAVEEGSETTNGGL